MPYKNETLHAIAFSFFPSNYLVVNFTQLNFPDNEATDGEGRVSEDLQGIYDDFRHIFSQSEFDGDPEQIAFAYFKPYLGNLDSPEEVVSERHTVRRGVKRELGVGGRGGKGGELVRTPPPRKSWHTVRREGRQGGRGRGEEERRRRG